MSWYAGVDVGASKIRAVVGSETGQIEARVSAETPMAGSEEGVTEIVLRSLGEVLERAALEPEEIAGCGIGAIGPLDMVRGEIVDSANLTTARERIPLVEPVERLLSAEVSLWNDANAGVIGERFYAERSPDDMVYLTLSTGVGAGVCIDGRVVSGWDGNAAEVGHLVVEVGGLECSCGGQGHWEAYASGANLPRHARAVAANQPVETDLNLETLTAETLYAAYGSDPLATMVLDRTNAYNLAGIVNLVHAYAPLVIVVGGAVARENPALVVDPIDEALADRVMSNVPEVKLTALGDESCVKGALAAAIEQLSG